MGIIDGMQTQQAQPMQPQAQPPQPPMQQQPQQVQAQPAQPQAAANPAVYQRVILASTKLIYDPKMMKNILDLIKKSKMPEIGLAQATSLIMAELAKKSNNTIPQNVKTPAAKEIMGLIAELAEKAGLIKDVEQTVKKASIIIALSYAVSSKIDPAKLKQAKRGNSQQPFMARQASSPEMV